MDSAWELMNTLDLLERISDNGIRFYFNEEGIALEYTKGKSVDPSLLREIELHKDSLRKYADLATEAPSDPMADLDLYASRVKYEGEYYYPITPVQTYWVDKQVDGEFKRAFKYHGSTFMYYQVDGNLDIPVFERAVYYVVQRHESLRSAFVPLYGQYYLKVLHGNHPDIFTYKDGRGDATSTVQSFVYYADHTFDLAAGPLFLVRLVQTEDNKYLLSIKIQHVIFDTVSAGILSADLLAAYAAIKAGHEPQLPALKYQYKEYLAYFNYLEARDAEGDRMYWRQLYPALPPSLAIPCAKKASSLFSDRIVKYGRFCYQAEVAERMKEIAKQFSVNLFVVLQAAVKTFFANLTGQKDLVIGTFTSGRNFWDCQNQVGCYAGTHLIRTVFDGNDSFADALEKVKKSNEDMKWHAAFPLKWVLAEMLPPGQPVYGSFWKINMQFFDKSYEETIAIKPGEYRDLEATFTRKDLTYESLLNIDLQLYFIHLNDALVVNVEYDSSCYDASDIANLMSLMMAHTKTVAENPAVKLSAFAQPVDLAVSNHP